MKKIVLVGAARTPIGSFLGSLSTIKASTLGAISISGTLEKTGLTEKDVDEVILGCVLQGGQGQNVARQAMLQAGLSQDTPAQTVNMVCGSGLRAVIDAARIIALGEADVIIAGGTESMSLAPYFLNKARTGLRMGNATFSDLMVHDGLTCAIDMHHMGITAEMVAEKFEITREQQDALAAESQRKAARAVEEGKFKEEIVPVVIPGKKGDTIVDADEYPRAGTTEESLAKLRPAFKTDGTVTAGNASGINDGAATVAVMSEDAAKERGLEPLAYIGGWSYAGTDPKYMGTGPIYAVKRLIEKTGVPLDKIDLIEANEAFAAQAIAVGKELGWHGTSLQERVNVNGGAIALGHPIGASGCRILTTLLYEMKRRSVHRGLATLCIGGGMGVSMLVERP